MAVGGSVNPLLARQLSFPQESEQFAKSYSVSAWDDRLDVGSDFRLDTQSVNAGRSSFGRIGVQPTVEYDFTDKIVGAAGVLFTAAGVDDVVAI